MVLRLSEFTALSPGANCVDVVTTLLDDRSIAFGDLVNLRITRLHSETRLICDSVFTLEAYRICKQRYGLILGAILELASDSLVATKAMISLLSLLAWMVMATNRCSSLAKLMEYLSGLRRGYTIVVVIDTKSSCFVWLAQNHAMGLACADQPQFALTTSATLLHYLPR